MALMKAQRKPCLISVTVTWRKVIHIILESVKITGTFIPRGEVCVVPPEHI